MDSRKQKLVDVTKEIFVEAKRRFKSGNTTKVISSKDDTKLNFYGDLLEYCVILNDDGYVINIRVSDGRWIASLDDGQSINDLSIDDLRRGNLKNYECK